MKKWIMTAMLAALSLSASAQNTFGIFVDERTYGACREELTAYRDVLRSEGLEARILAADWKTPEQVRDVIRRLASSKRHPLEGVVFVGDIPIVMVREAQWMTTAFKMNEQRFPIFESSVASDRFYDDFDLDFERIAQDTARADVFYYRLTEKGAVSVSCDIYSSRMKVPAWMTAQGQDADEVMRRYLRKVVAAHLEENPLDRFTFFYGNGYNSEDMNIWRQRPSEYKEYFPEAFRKASGHRFLNFHQEAVMKWNLLSELQREEVDLFQFSEHGAPETQYISPTGEARTLDENLSLLKSVTGRQYLRWKGTSEDEKFQHAALDSVFHLPRSVVSDSALAVYRRVDSLAQQHANIYLEDLAAVRSNPRVVILNACFNGSFHDPEGYIAGMHVFGDGRCVVAQGNTVNVLQDKWEDKLLGYLPIGLRIGFWQQEFTYLESHLIGDPTFRFSADRKRSVQMERDLVRHRGKASVWQRYLRSAEPMDRAMGILHLAGCGDASASSEALRLLKEDPSKIVRISAFDVLRSLSDGHAEEAILTASRDPFELVVRHACRFASARADAGKDSCIVRAMELLYNDHPDLARVNWDADDALTMIRGHEHLDTETAKAADTSLSDMQRIYAMRTFRNYRYLKAVPVLLANATDPAVSLPVRQVALETLGWYDAVPGRAGIIRALQEADRQDPQMPAPLRSELRKTCKRLSR